MDQPPPPGVLDVLISYAAYLGWALVGIVSLLISVPVMRIISRALRHAAPIDPSRDSRVLEASIVVGTAVVIAAALAY